MLNTCWRRLLPLFFAGAMILTFDTQSSAFDTDPQMTGLPELTQEEIQWQNKHQNRVKKIKPNKIALERINAARHKEGRPGIDLRDIDMAPLGREIEAAPGAVTASSESTIAAADFPSAADNSKLKYFPPIRSQGSLPSCGAFSGTYYAMTHMWALINNLDAKNGGDDFRLSPKWNYNMINGGGLNGSWYYTAYAIGQQHGTATWAEFPYDSDYREWCLVPSTWLDAIYRRFDTYGYVANTNTDAGIEQVKQMLLNGYVLNFPTYISSWQWTTIKNDPTTTEDDALVGKSIAYWVNGQSGYHAMTVVGYNDAIWTDINGNGKVDSGEKGAFRIANSWGTGWKEGGFAWMAYDALKNPSAVYAAPATNRIAGWYPARAHWVTARANYEPKLVAEFTLDHARRNQLRVTLGVSDLNQKTPTTSWYPQMIAFNGGPYAFDGTTTPISGTFVFDFTDLAASSNGQRWHLGLYDNTTGYPVELLTYTLIDMIKNQLAVDARNVPLTADGQQLYTAIDYEMGSGTNLPPVARAEATSLNGNAPLKVVFDAGRSTDADGRIVDFHWDFGDGASLRGEIVEHTYWSAGRFTAVLTVTDDMGNTAAASLSITVNDPDYLNPPSDLSASTAGSKIVLSWNDTSNNEDGFYIERGTKIRGQLFYERIGQAGPSQTTYFDTCGSGTYYYRVQTVSRGTVSEYSNVVTVRIK